jgi:hypothetical protein
VLGGQDEVALVFAVFVVGDDDHFALADVGNDGLDGIKMGFHQRAQANGNGGKSHIIHGSAGGDFVCGDGKFD